MRKNIIICSDGTGNSAIKDRGTNVFKLFEAIDLNVSAPVITESLIRRIRSREENNFTDRMLAIMRNAFGGHAVKKD